MRNMRNKKNNKLHRWQKEKLVFLYSNLSKMDKMFFLKAEMGKLEKIAGAIFWLFIR